ncbi:AMP-binding protein [Microbispora sp. RL4-1S]|uniref:AMP-binding protein n=1 Tax=Microbispora oryzae TaxID=2806554 RepID=A0A941AIT2_9ACTN|nr:AMP-binding protein [Microbispora oryzae]MBP2705506.1 AMP-binding protein [Microbispora oryzae]
MDYRKLNELVRFVREKSPFYGELYQGLPDRIDDITTLPIVDHTAFWEANTTAKNRVLTAPLTDALIFKTGGTTGAPKFAAYSSGEWQDFVLDLGHSMVRNGLHHGHRVANLFYGGELYASFVLWHEALIRISTENVLLPMGGAASPAAISTVLSDFEVQVTCSTPTTICRVANHLLEQGRTLPSMEIVFFAGEPIFEDQRRLLAAAFPNAEICAAIYGSVDSGVIGRPMRGRDQRLFLGPDRDAVLEIVDEVTGEPIREPGRTGRLIKTDLRRRLLPVLRYPVGDLAEWVDPASGLYRLKGRHVEGLRIGPVTLFTEDVRGVVDGLSTADAIIGMQLVAYRSDGLDGLLIKLAARPDFADADATAAELIATLDKCRPLLAETVSAGMIHPVRVEWSRYGDLEVNNRSGKLRAVIDTRPTD